MMSHDLSFISRMLKNKKHGSTPEELETSSDIAIDMEFYHADEVDKEEK